ncbi:MAG TPA: rhodanese-like domain-containing protein [Balneolales bacterium]|nr:rhodanese-like domain-containing protein [Balneolales bacterium]
MEKKPHVLSTNEMVERITDSDCIVVDIRPIEAYNGWKLRGETRGGHIKGAKSLPLLWTKYMDWVEVLDEKGISSDKPIIVYGYSTDSAMRMVDRLYGLDFGNVNIYDHFVDEWAARPGLPMDCLARYRQLVYPEWVKRLVTNGDPPEYEGNGYVICHSHYDNHNDYEEGHLPGAVPLNTLLLEDPVTWNRRSPDELRRTLLDLGITRDTTVIVYGRFSYPKFEDPFPGKNAGHLGAFRCAAILLYAGVEDVRILNGGITSWKNSGYNLSTEDVRPTPVNDFGSEIPAHPEYIVDLPEAKELLASENGELVSVRSWEEFIGNTSGYHYIEKKGRIPGAVFGNCGSDAYHMENYRNFDYTMRESQEVAKKWAEVGIVPEKHIAFYCGTGWRGSEAFMNAWLMGWPKVSVYDGGWFEWSNDPSNPIATGEPESL